jgi:hypothetical protein
MPRFFSLTCGHGKTVESNATSAEGEIWANGGMITMYLRALFTIFLLTSTASVFAQQRDMQQWITGDSQQQTEQRLTSLGVDKTAVDGLKEPRFEYGKWNSLRTRTREQYATLFLPCALDTAYLY